MEKKRKNQVQGSTSPLLNAYLVKEEKFRIKKKKKKESSEN